MSCGATYAPTSSHTERPQPKGGWVVCRIRAIGVMTRGAKQHTAIEAIHMQRQPLWPSAHPQPRLNERAIRGRALPPSPGGLSPAVLPKKPKRVGDWTLVDSTRTYSAVLRCDRTRSSQPLVPSERTATLFAEIEDCHGAQIQTGPGKRRLGA